MATQKRILLLLCVAVFYETRAENGAILQQDIISYRDSFYGALFKVGTPQQDVYLNVVVGRAITTNPKVKVASTKCAECCFEKTFNSTASTTFKKDHSITSQQEKADRGWDSLTVPAAGGKAVQLESQPIDVVTSEGQANVFTQQTFDGIIDFSLDANNVVGVAAKASLIKAPIYTIYLERTCTSGTSPGGTLTYGAVDSTNCKPTPNYVPVTQVKESKLNTIWVESASLGSALSSLNWKAGVTATGPMVMPTKVFNVLAASWNATARLMNGGYIQWIVDCDKKFDPLVLTIGGQSYTIPYYAYVRHEADECHLGLVAIDGDAFANSGSLSLGLPFSYQHCVVFDLANSKIGFAEHVKQQQTTTCKYDTETNRPHTRCASQKTPGTVVTTTPSSADKAAMHVFVASLFVLCFLYVME